MVSGTVGVPGFNNTAGSVQYNLPGGLARSGSTLLIADEGNNCIRRLQLDTNVVTTFAGGCTASKQPAGATDGPALQALFSAPHRLSFDGAGNLYIGEVDNPGVRRIVNALSASNPVVDTPIGVLDNQFGVKVGLLPARLNAVMGIATTSGVIYVLSEQALLQVR